MKRTVALAVTLAAAFIACRGGGDDTSGDDDSPDAPSGAYHIQDVQNDNMAAGTQVSLKGVVVTAIDRYGMKAGDFWVEEPAGGEFSGVHVFGADPSEVEALTVGDLVDISGAEKDEFTYTGSNGSGGDPTGRSVTELKPVSGGVMKVMKTGTGTVPAPQMVDALAIGMKATQAEKDAEWEKWEGVLIKVVNVTATNSPTCIKSQMMCKDETNNNFDITGGAVVETSLAPLPGFMPSMGQTAAVPSSIARGDCLAGITGVVDYFFDYLLLNTPDGVQTGGTGCAVAEAAAQCGDGIDNDGNGYADCLDNNCIATSSSCSVATTIPAIQATTPTGAVTLANVYITALSNDKKSIWVSTDLTASPNNGIYVFRASNTAFAATDVGSKVNVTGPIQEYNDDAMGGTLTEFNVATTTIVAPAAGALVPVTDKTAEDLLVVATAPTYESVLVTLTNVNITALGTGTNGFVATATQGATTFKIGTDSLHLTAADMGCHATMTGLWTNLQAPSTGATTKPNAFGFIPTSMSAVGGTCN